MRDLLSTVGATLQTDTYVKYNLGSSQLFVELDAPTNTIKFTVNVPTKSYFSIGFGEDMYDTDMLLWQARTSALTS